MSILARLKISQRIFVVGVASLLGLLLVTGLAMMELKLSLQHSFETRTKQTLDVAYSQLERFHAEEAAGRMTRAQAQKAAAAAVNSLRFGKLGYFFMFDNDMTMVAHPVKSELVGTNVRDKTDAVGKMHYREMREKAAGPDGGGFVRYQYQMPNGEGIKEKLSYARGFAPWGWVIATGVLNDEIEAALWHDAGNLAKMVLFVILLIGGVIWMIGRSITLPLRSLTERMRSLAGGNVTDAIPGIERKDELGDMAGALQVFREQAVAKEEAQAAKAKGDAEQQMIVALVSDKLERLSDGDLTSKIDEDVPGSYAALKRNFNTAIANLSELIGALADASHGIETGATEIAAASDDLARRTESNAASLEQTSAALSQMNDRLKSSAQSADRTVDCTQSAIAMVDTGRSTAEQATGAMDRVGESARGIDDVIEGLDKIAFQTRVLAMNAAVEAGRAGEAGRGFAVVADLVSALAMRAEEEAHRAREQLTATQSDIGIAVDAVRSVDTALANITGSVQQVHEFVESMATDNRAQVVTIGEIASAMNTMDQSTQQNAAMVEQTSAAARNLAGEVRTLTRQSSRFTVEQREGSARRIPAMAAPSERGAKTAASPKAATRTEAVKPKPAMPPRNVQPVAAAAMSAAGGAEDDWASF
ncbi:methyl-accepting chemotaxis protein [Stakelama sp. CBK3Z-3]|uniref:Methyl-accepting chemotaxis protein n=1 Tax=Stakelama flava TaxID=2860338 RepID=A0ABS6XLX6_9SPHN|nr:methyl-accepting chemotaxis protein [Stakelama flava]MBW4330391.1 methyl-accepting chemotaxis protein [Stakelama flava]